MIHAPVCHLTDLCLHCAQANRGCNRPRTRSERRRNAFCQRDGSTHGQGTQRWDKGLLEK